MPPPGGGENTVTDALPTETRLAVAMAAVSCVALTKVVGRSAPFQRTVDPDVKLLPFTVSVKPALPAVVLDGVSELIAGVVLPADWTVTEGLVAARVFPPLGKYLNS